MPREKFSDRQKKNIVKMYIECQNACAVARKYGCSETTVRRILHENPDVAKMLAAEKRKNTEGVRSHMKQQLPQVYAALDSLLEYISAEDTLSRASVRDLATALGILIDKYSVTEDEESKTLESGVVILPQAIERSVEDGKE